MAAPEVNYAERVIETRKTPVRTLTGETTGENLESALIERTFTITEKGKSGEVILLSTDKTQGWVTDSRSIERENLLSVHELKIDSSGVVSWVAIKNGVISVVRCSGDKWAVVTKYVIDGSVGEIENIKWRGGRLNLTNVDVDKAVVSEEVNMTPAVLSMKSKITKKTNAENNDSDKKRVIILKSSK